MSSDKNFHTVMEMNFVELIDFERLLKLYEDSRTVPVSSFPEPATLDLVHTLVLGLLQLKDAFITHCHKSKLGQQ